MHYIRFLKHPTVAQNSKRLLEIKALVTITSDLGESTYPEDAQLTATLIDARSPGRKNLQQASLEWKASSHALSVVFETTAKALAKTPILQVMIEVHHDGIRTATPSTDVQYLLELPHILPTITPPFSLGHSTKDPDSLPQRPIPLYNDPISFSVGEDTGPSIDRHVWDAGVGLCALFSWLIHPATAPDHLQLLTACIRSQSSLHALELGTGVGLVGLALAHLRRTAARHGRTEITLTDVESARAIAERNTSQLLHNQPRSPAAAPDSLSISFAPLDWEAPLPDTIAACTYDLVLVSDCTYNPDSGPALVRTLAALAASSPGLLIVVASKTRHASEAVFWERMHDAGFGIREHARLLARGGVDEDSGVADEIVHVHLFEQGHA